MKSTFSLLACLLFMLVSCSTYKEVSVSNFKKYEITFDERNNLQYVLKKNELHYSDNDSRNNINFYNPDRSTICESHSFDINENIVIPNGACGSCLNSSDDNFIIDFGEGVQVPFKIYNENNRAGNSIEVDGRVYDIEVSNRNARLYFDTRGIKPSK